MITLMTDFSTQDGYVGAMKGAIKSCSQSIEIIDITHDIKPYNTGQAAFTLLNYFSTFPDKTVHLCVVDPRVGSERAGLIVETDKHYLVGPDNGIFDLVVAHKKCVCYKINGNLFPGSSSTFHGRDIFAPVAARICLGTSPVELGEQFKPKQTIKQKIQIKSSVITVHPITYDRFGNIIFGIHKNELKLSKIKKIVFKHLEFNSISEYYAQVPLGNYICIWNSSEYLEIAKYQGNACDTLVVDFNTDELKIFLEA